MGEIDEGLERASRTRAIPQSTAARVRFLVRSAKGSTRAVAEELGVSQRTVQRWLKGASAPKPEAVGRIEQQVRAKWQPRVRQRTRRAAERDGFVLHVQAQFGYSSAVGSSDDPRMRTITQRMPGEVARRLYAARDAGAGTREQEQVLADALQEHYFKDGGRRASGLTTEINGMNWADFEVD
ncbi:telomere-protecting terminal protein Tpg [Kitasatospora sp. NPDC059571]|uniref:telomere-protecting terminal protein Tpg n=1 Tax=Kitasatospora sp. NPDC059571 TaxID=3346871 RepID=UPI0036C4D882